MAQAKFDIKTEATRPFYAGVGVTDLAVERVRGYVADVQKKFADVQKDVQKSVSDLDFQPQALRDQATTVVSARVDALAKDAKARRAAIEARVAELQDEAKAYPARVQSLLTDNVATTYTELVKRGETLVGRIRRQPSTQRTASSAKTTTAKAKTTTTQAKKTAKTTAKKTASTAKKTAKKSPAKSSAKATTTAAKKTVSNAAEAAGKAAQKVGD